MVESKTQLDHFLAARWQLLYCGVAMATSAQVDEDVKG